MTSPLEIVPLGTLERDPELPAWLAAALSRKLPLAARVAAPLELREEWRALRRDQYASHRIVDALIDRDGDRLESGWTLALTDVDLFAPRRSFVFGEATRGGAWAVVSTARLHPHPPPDSGAIPLLRDRVLNVAVHEIGHLADLGHCRSPDCVMHPAGSAEDADRRPGVFCASCRSSFAVSSGLKGTT